MQTVQPLLKFKIQARNAAQWQSTCSAWAMPISIPSKKPNKNSYVTQSKNNLIGVKIS